MTRQKNICFLLIVVFCFIIFLPCLFNKFTNYDDNIFIVNNPFIRQLNLANLKAIWTSHMEGGYQPLTIFSFALEHHFFKLDPFFYHLDNLILHAANACLVFVIVFRLIPNIFLAFLTAILFAISPLRVESVAWVSERKDVLFSFFYLSAIVMYMKERIWACWVLFLAACLAKHQAVSLPFVLLLIDYWNGWGTSWRNWLNKWPFFVTGFVLGFVTLAKASSFFGNTHLTSIADKIFLMGYGIVLYAMKVFFPNTISCLYSAPQRIGSFFPWQVYASMLLVLAWGVLLFFLRKQKVIIFGSMFFLITLAASLTNIVVGDVSFINDRYTYLPCIGLYFLALWAVVHLLKLEFKSIILACLVVYLPSMAFLTYQRCRVWYDGITLWSDTIHQYPQLYFLYDNRGSVYLEKGQNDLAFEDFSKAIELNPLFASAYTNRAIVFDKKGEKGLALKDFDKAIELDPNYGAAYFNRGIFHLRNKDNFMAQKDFEKAKTLGVGAL